MSQIPLSKLKEIPIVSIIIAGIEYITDKSGERYTYDVNTNTNYNSVAEKKVNKDGMLEIAKFLKAELKNL